MVGKSYDESKILPFLQRIKNGESLLSLSHETGIHRNTFLKYLRKLGIERPKKSGAPKQLMLPLLIPEPPLIPSNATVLVIPDLHSPFLHPDALSFLLCVQAAHKTNVVVCLGDEIDAHAFSRYTPDPDGLAPGQELSRAIEKLRPFYREFPTVFVCESNHTSRPWKKAFEAGLPEAFLPTYSRLLDAPDEWFWASRHNIDDVLYIHGDNGRSGQYAHIHYMKQAKRSVVIGHIHGFAGVNYEAEHFAMNAGCLIDENAYCFKYAKNMLIKVNLGCGIVHEGRYAQFIPMRTDKHGRWIGRL